MKIWKLGGKTQILDGCLLKQQLYQFKWFGKLFWNVDVISIVLQPFSQRLSKS